ncbi:cilia- and flagella-associated protein 184 [Ctenodactylus gundi]
MDSPSERAGAPAGERGDEEGPASQPAAAAAETEASERDAAADEEAEARDEPAAAELAGGDGSGEPTRLAKLEPRSESEEPAKPRAEAGVEKPEEPGEAEEDADRTAETKARKAMAHLRASLQLTAIPEVGGAAPPTYRDIRKAMERKAGDEEHEWPEEMQQLRSELLDNYRTLVAERSRCQRYNSYLQHQICEVLRRKKGREAAEERGPEPEAPEKEQAYLHYLATLEELKKQEVDDLEWYQQEVGQLRRQCQEKLADVERRWRRFQALKKQVVMQVMGSCRLRGGRQAALREVEQVQALEDRKEQEMSAVRLENVQLKQSLAHFETRMRAQEDLTEGLLLIDFEQLKIENQTFNEKVEERQEELLKLRTKVANHVKIVTHVKEKLHFVDMENACKKTQLGEIEARVARQRDTLTKMKQARDRLRADNVRLTQKCGLLGKESLLRDLEAKVSRTEQLTQHLESLKRHHAGLTLSCKGVKQKIREARAFLPS